MEAILKTGRRFRFCRFVFGSDTLWNSDAARMTRPLKRRHFGLVWEIGHLKRCSHRENGGFA